MEPNWKIWNVDESVEQRTYQRATGELPEMESTKQLVEMIQEIYEPGMKVLDVGCAAGHYYRGLQRIDPKIDYTGIDATVPYINFAKKHFTDPNVKFYVEDIFNIPEHLGKFDIVFCCNVILHLPDFRVPIKNLLNVTKKRCLIRTLMSEKTLLCKFLYKDEFDAQNNPTNFVYQNTYSHELLTSYVKSLGNYNVEIIEDKFDEGNINKEHKDYSDKQSAVTRVIDHKQVAGNVILFH
jgi:2-polyprenyl-3-methyl-5-hydroxy-6-metoxy-1,4-benzoquinol methylase